EELLGERELGTGVGEHRASPSDMSGSRSDDTGRWPSLAAPAAPRPESMGEGCETTAAHWPPSTLLIDGNGWEPRGLRVMTVNFKLCRNSVERRRAAPDCAHTPLQVARHIGGAPVP